jgi:hypothetical protein
MAEVFGAFTRALRDADLSGAEVRGVRCAGILAGRARQGIVPDLQIGTALHELKGIRSDRSHSNF